LSAELIDRSLVGRGTTACLSAASRRAREVLSRPTAVWSMATDLAAPTDRVAGPDDGYFFDNITYHMAQANRAQELNRLLLDYDWLRAKLAVRGIIRLLADFAQQPMTADVEAVDRALVLSAACLAARPDRLASNLASRLVGSPSPESIACSEKCANVPQGPGFARSRRHRPRPASPAA